MCWCMSAVAKLNAKQYTSIYQLDFNEYELIGWPLGGGAELRPKREWALYFTRDGR